MGPSSVEGDVPKGQGMVPTGVEGEAVNGDVAQVKDEVRWRRPGDDWDPERLRGAPNLRWILQSYQSYKDFLTAWEDGQTFRKNNPEFVEEQTKMNEEIDYSEFESKLRFMRLLLKQW